MMRFIDFCKENKESLPRCGSSATGEALDFNEDASKDI